VSVDGRIDPNAEDVLVVLGQGARAHDVAPGGLLARVDVDDADNARCAGFDRDPAGLIEFEL
jgi:hypothetical protein